MRSTITLAAVFALLVLGTLGCSEAPDSPTMTAPDIAGPTAQYVVTPCGTPLEPILYAGQYIDTGVVYIYNDDTNLYIEITTAGGWELTETHVAVAPSMELIPQTGSGNPKVGQFDLAAVHEPPVTSYIYTVPDPNYTPVYIAVHAVVQLVQDGQVVQEETAWADGAPFPGANWATYIVYDMQECGGPITGACCVGYECFIMTEAECANAGGDFDPEAESCDPSPCPQPLGACCLPDGSCQFITAGECADAGGVFDPEAESCDPNPCAAPPAPLGACCLPDGTCTILTQDECTASDGTYGGDDSTCGQVTCVPMGSCCMEDGSCAFVSQDECTTSGGIAWHEAMPCEWNLCQPE